MVDVADTLLRHFTPEQVARLGNTHLIHSSLGRHDIETLMRSSVYSVLRQYCSASRSPWTRASTGSSTATASSRCKACDRCCRVSPTTSKSTMPASTAARHPGCCRGCMRWAPGAPTTRSGAHSRIRRAALGTHRAALVALGAALADAGSVAASDVVAGRAERGIAAGVRDERHREVPP